MQNDTCVMFLGMILLSSRNSYRKAQKKQPLFLATVDDIVEYFPSKSCIDLYVIRI